MVIYIYALIGPNNEYLYIGQTKDLQVRIRAHLNGRTGRRVADRVWAIGKKNVRAVVLEESDGGHWRERERYWIALAQEDGHPLCNIHPGGGGIEFTEEVRQKISNALRGLRRTEEQKKANSERQKRVWEDPEYRRRREEMMPDISRRISKTLMGHLVSEETRQKQSEAAKRRFQDAEERCKVSRQVQRLWQDPEYRENQRTKGKQNWQDWQYRIKQSVAHKGHVVSEETKHKISESMRGGAFSQEHKRALSEAKRGHEVSDATREKIRKANTGRRHSKKTRQRLSEISRALWQDPAYRNKQAESRGRRRKR